MKIHQGYILSFGNWTCFSLTVGLVLRLVLNVHWEVLIPGWNSINGAYGTTSDSFHLQSPLRFVVSVL